MMVERFFFFFFNERACEIVINITGTELVKAQLGNKALEDVSPTVFLPWSG